MNPIKLSVIVPVYNAESTLRKCLDSILQQNLEGMELVIVDDGSKDKSCVIEEDFAKSYPNIIKLYKKENGGEASARNAGLKLVTGEYTSFVDSDDYVKPGYYSALFDAIESAAEIPDVVISGSSRSENGIDTEKHISMPGLINQKQLAEQFFDRSRDADMRVVWNKLFRTKIIRGLEFENRVCATDQIFCLQVFSLVENALFVDSCGYVQWMNPNSITHTLAKKYDPVYELAVSMQYRAYTGELYREMGISDEAVYLEHCRTDYVWFYILVKNVMNPGSPYQSRQSQINIIRSIMSEKEPRACIINCTYRSKLSFLVKLLYTINSPQLARFVLSKL